MRRTVGFLFVVWVWVLAAGCASKGMVVKNANFDPRLYTTEQKEAVRQDAGKVVADYLIEPDGTTGFLETEPMRKGKFITREVVIPEDLLGGELYPGRIRWNAIAVAPNGREFFAQVGFLFRTETTSTGKVQFIGGLIIDGEEKDLVDAKVIGLSTRGSFGYDLSEAEKKFSIKWNDFRDKVEIRHKLALTHGTSVASLKPARDLLSLVNNWNRFTFSGGYLLSPLGEPELKEIAGINPQYSFSQKWVSTGKLTISTDYIGTATGILFDLFKAIRTKSNGWDFESRNPENDKVRKQFLEKIKSNTLAQR